MDTETTTPQCVSQDEHQKVLEDLRKEREILDAKTKQYWALKDRISTAEELIKDALAEDNIDEDLAKELAEALDIKLTRKVTYELTFSIEATVELPVGAEPDDVSESDFDIDDLTYTGDGDLDDWSISSRDCNQQ